MVVVVVVVATTGTTLVVRTLWRRLDDPPAAAPAAPAQQNTQQMMLTQMPMGRMMVKNITAITIPTIAPVTTPVSMVEKPLHKHTQTYMWIIERTYERAGPFTGMTCVLVLSIENHDKFLW